MEEQPLNPGGDKPRRGRPTRLTPELALGVAQCILDGMYRYQAGKRFNVQPYLFRRWMQQGYKFPDGLYGQFRSLVLESETEAERLHIANVCKAGRDEDWKASAWWLERKFPGRWGRLRGELEAVRRELRELREAVRDASVRPGSDGRDG